MKPSTIMNTNNPSRAKAPHAPGKYLVRWNGSYAVRFIKNRPRVFTAVADKEATLFDSEAEAQVSIALCGQPRMAFTVEPANTQGAA